MYPSDVVFHVVHAAKDPAALLALGTPPLAPDARIVLRLVTRAVLLAREPAATREAAPPAAGFGDRAGLGLRAATHAAEKVLGVSLEVLAEVTAPGEHGAGGAAGIRAPAGVWGAHAQLWDWDAIGE